MVLFLLRKLYSKKAGIYQVEKTNLNILVSLVMYSGSLCELVKHGPILSPEPKISIVIKNIDNNRCYAASHKKLASYKSLAH